MFQNAKMNYTVRWVKSEAASCPSGEVIVVSQKGRTLATYQPSSLGKGWERRKRINWMMENGPLAI